MMRLIVLALLLGSVSATAAPDMIYLDADVIEGNQELPRVLYILPWREQRGEPVDQPSPVLAPPDWRVPIKPDEHRRQLLLRHKLEVHHTQGE